VYEYVNVCMVNVCMCECVRECVSMNVSMFVYECVCVCGKNWGREIFFKKHKSEVIHGHWHQEWEWYTELEAIHLGSRPAAFRLVGTQRVMGSVSGKGETQPLLISGLCSLVGALC
jgi:hypothetical protein